PDLWLQSQPDSLSLIEGLANRGDHLCVHEYGIPNFYFHLTMTYALLRQAGVDLGKRDYLGGLNLQ
uniref:DUF1993 family protein n=1 Tax=Aeromonas caviae TaxID=648 RepID=UPI003F743919